MSNETYITEKEDGTYVLVNGNSETQESWTDYEEAKEAMKADNKLQAEADKKEDPDLYNDNCAVTWVA